MTCVASAGAPSHLRDRQPPWRGSRRACVEPVGDRQGLGAVHAPAHDVSVADRHHNGVQACSPDARRCRVGAGSVPLEIAHADHSPTQSPPNPKNAVRNRCRTRSASRLGKTLSSPPGGRACRGPGARSGGPDPRAPPYPAHRDRRRDDQEVDAVPREEQPGSAHAVKVSQPRPGPRPTKEDPPPPVGRAHSPVVGLSRPSDRQSCPTSRNALNSNALPDGSRKNIVHCSPGSPSNRTYGSITKSVPASVSRCAAPGTGRRRAPARSAAPAPRDRRPRWCPRPRAVVVDLVRDHLVPLDVPVRPAGVRPATAEPEHLAIEVPGRLDVVHWDREVEGRACRGGHVRLSTAHNPGGRACRDPAPMARRS